MKPIDLERFDRIRRSIQFGVTIKDLAWLVRLVEKLDRQLAAASHQLPVKSREEVPVKRTVNFVFVEVADPTLPDGKNFGIECDACGARFFDLVSKGVSARYPWLIQTGIPLAIEHAKTAHQSTGGIVVPRAAERAALKRPVMSSSAD